MYNLVIVDDEKLTRECLLKYINWSKLGIQSIYTVASGQKALDIMQEYTIHILISDIKMPRMNGIELATQVRAKYPECKIIFLSGYCDKEYLKSALQLKIYNYIEKPLNVSEIESVVSAVVQELENESSKKEKEAILVSGIEKSLPVMKQEIALALINSNLDYNHFKSKYSPLYFNWQEESTLFVCCILPDQTRELLGQSKELINAVYHVLELEPGIPSFEFYAGQTSEGMVVLIANHTNRVSLFESLTILQQGLNQALQLTVTIGVSSIVFRLTDLPMGYSEACLAIQERFYSDGNHIYSYRNNTTGAQLDPALFSALEINFEGVSRLFDLLSERQYKDIENVKHQLYGLYTIMMERTLNKKVISYSEFSVMTLKQMREFILFGMHALRTLGDDQYDPKVKDAIKYILWNYFDTGLSITTVADAVGLSPNYLCSLFKKNTGSTLNDFFLQIRVEKSKRLLRTTNLRLYEICDRVGVADPNYFSALFKRESGMTPREYRNACKGDVNQ
ncbi:MAG: two component transcriptional regulator, AraC family [Herbinix sp.]|jgi:two-component system response regulator YesN|nr:two component transcriptional regulator, AraC family [Herbinix sp.]